MAVRIEWLLVVQIANYYLRKETYSLTGRMSEQATSLYVQIRRFDGTETACQGQGPYDPHLKQ